MNKIIEEFLYKVIIYELDTLVTDNLTESYDNIKIATSLIYLNIESELVYLNNDIIFENEFFEYFADAKFSNIGRMIQVLFGITDVAAGTITSGGVSSYLTTTLSGSLGITGAGLVSGLGPLLLLILSYGIYKKIDKNEILNVAKIVRTLHKLSNILKVSIDQRINTEFKYLLEHKCNYIKDKDLRIQCAITGYIKFLSSFVLSPLIIRYIEYLSRNNDDLSLIKSFTQLALFKSKNVSNVSNLMNNFYITYLKLLRRLNVNKSIIGDNFRLLNNITQTALKKVN